jgi:hypothetical protein
MEVLTLVRRGVVGIVMLTWVMLVCGCSKTDDGRKPTSPVTGEVYVDGQPAAGVHVKFHDVKGFDAANPTVSASMTDESGHFSASTYDQGDGVPAGDYTVTFEWGELNKFSMQYSGDKLKGKYSDPEKTEHRITVTDGSSTDMGRIELKTK